MAPIGYAVWMLVEVACDNRAGAKPKIVIPVEGVLVVTEKIQPTTASDNLVCPADMKHVSGVYCPQVEQKCLEWVDATGKITTAPVPGQTGRCGTFQQPSRCLTPEAKRPFKDFCIDTFEHGGSTTSRPQSWMNWYDAKSSLEREGKRLCTDSEWTMACEGPDMLPYPYGNGYHRDRTACNFDNSAVGFDVFKATSRTTETAQRLDALLVFSGTMPRCVSPFGVFDMVGNLDEWVVNESGSPYVSGLKSGHVFGVRNACRPMTEAHGPTFAWYETGTRGCLSLN